MLQHLASYVCTGNPNADSHVCLASSLPAELSPKPPDHFKMQNNLPKLTWHCGGGCNPEQSSSLGSELSLCGQQEPQRGGGGSVHD